MLLPDWFVALAIYWLCLGLFAEVLFKVACANDGEIESGLGDDLFWFWSIPTLIYGPIQLILLPKVHLMGAYYVVMALYSFTAYVLGSPVRLAVYVWRFCTIKEFRQLHAAARKKKRREAALRKAEATLAHIDQTPGYRRKKMIEEARAKANILETEANQLMFQELEIQQQLADKYPADLKE